MKTQKMSVWPACVASGVLLLTAGQSVQAQGVIVPGGGGRFYIELKDANLADALEMIFRAAPNSPPRIIDPSAKEVNIGTVTFPNRPWEEIVRDLANRSGFLVKKNASGATVIEPRERKTTGGGGPGGAVPGGPRPGGGPTVPANPFGAALDKGEGATTLATAQMSDKTQFGTTPGAGTFTPLSGPQYSGRSRTTTGTGTGRTGGTTTGGTDRRSGRRELSPDGEYRIVIIKHVYAGGIARLFADSSVIPTEVLVTPESAAMGGGGGGGGGGGFSGGQGGQSGQGGGFSNSSNSNSGGGGFSSGGSSSGGGFGGFSDRNMKENVGAVDNRAILDRVKDLPIATWNYKSQDPAIRHIGPMAQDFSAAFGVGEDDKRINFIDANGVTLASIQALYKMAQEQAAQLKALQGQLEELKAENQKLRGEPVPAAQPAPKPVQ